MWEDNEETLFANIIPGVWNRNMDKEDRLLETRNETVEADHGCNIKGRESEEIRSDLGEVNTRLKAREDRFRVYGHILWVVEENKVKQTMRMEVRGT